MEDDSCQSDMEEVSLPDSVRDKKPTCSSMLAFDSDKRAGDYVNDPQHNLPEVIPLNVGGYRFITRLSTLCKHKDSMLAAMFSGRHKVDKDSSGHYFIDSNGQYFQYILDYLRHNTFPPFEVAEFVYKEACYYNLVELIEYMQTTPIVSGMMVKEMHRGQFPDYQELKQKIVRIAMDNAVVSQVGEVIIHAFRKQFVPRAHNFNTNHECMADTAHLNVGPWDAVADEDILIKCLEADFTAEGFSIRPHEQRRRCKYYNGQSCQKFVYKITFNFY